MVVEAFESIQRRVFDADGLGGGDVSEHLRAKLAGQFGIEDMPHGFFLFQIELGGLDLVNPLIPLFRVQEKSLADPMNRIEEAIEEKEADYDRAKKVFEEGTLPSRSRGTSLDTGELMSLDEYTRYREETSVHLHRAYTTLMNVPETGTLEYTPEVAKAFWSLKYGSYDHWILELYGPDIIWRYDGLEMGEKKLLPIGLASLLQSEKVRWKG